MSQPLASPPPPVPRVGSKLGRIGAINAKDGAGEGSNLNMTPGDRMSDNSEMDPLPNKFTTDAWDALRQECCVNPATAVRCVMVSEEAFRAAMAKVLSDRRWLLQRLAFDPKEGDTNA